MPDLDLIIQAKQGCGRSEGPIPPLSGESTTITTNPGGLLLICCRSSKRLLRYQGLPLHTESRLISSPAAAQIFAPCELGELTCAATGRLTPCADSGRSL